MSKPRIENKLRKNMDFQAITSHLDGLGLAWVARGPTGKGHPYLEITLTDGQVIIYHVACTPRGGGNKKKALVAIRNFLDRRSV